MFWKTCLDHTFEILLALFGAGILGYLVRSLFGSKAQDVDVSEYENQISSLRDRVKSQDNQISTLQGAQSTWASEKAGLESKLKEQGDLRTSFEGYISPEDHRNITTDYESQLHEKHHKLGLITAERDGLLNQIKSLEAKSGEETWKIAITMKSHEINKPLPIPFDVKKYVHTKD